MNLKKNKKIKKQKREDRETKTIERERNTGDKEKWKT